MHSIAGAGRQRDTQARDSRGLTDKGHGCGVKQNKHGNMVMFPHHGARDWVSQRGLLLS